METVADMLASQPFLAGLSSERMHKLAPWSRTVTFPTGARIFDEGRRAERFWLIRQGRVSLETQVPGRGAVVVESLGRGAVLGWSWLFPPYRWHFSATAVETTLAVELDGPGVRDLCERDHDLGYELMSRFVNVVVDRMQTTRLRLLDLYGRPS